MKDITDITVIQIRLFPVDVIPFNIISTQSCVQKIKESFSLTVVESPPFLDNINSIMFQKGEFKSNKQIIIINKIEIEPRRIILEVTGTSQQANEVYDSLLISISEAVNIEVGRLRQPLLNAENTRCVVTLDFHISELFSKSFMSFLNNDVKNKASTQLASGIVEPIGILTQISYQIKDETLIKNAIGMNPKQFTITPRSGVPIEEKRFVTSSPFDSDTHLGLIKTLNNLMVKKVKK
ncbi:MAG: hypothetical protein WC370_05020 [Dehalococcoidales bacterium]